MVKELNVLFGFEAPTVEQKILNCLKSYGIAVTGAVRYTKPTIKDYLLKNKDVDIVFLKEFLDGGEKYSSNEMAEVADITRARFIVVVNPANRGREAMKTLYCAGILDAFFSDDKKGVPPEDLAKAAVVGRTRLEARTFYAIDSPMPDYGVLNYEDYRDCYSYLVTNLGNGSQEIDRFIDITRFLSVKQMYQFYKKLPEQDVTHLMQYAEFYDIMDTLRGRGLPVEKFKRPRELLTATGPELADRVMREKMVRKAPKPAHNPVENPDFSEFRREPINRNMNVPPDDAEEQEVYGRDSYGRDAYEGEDPEYYDDGTDSDDYDDFAEEEYEYEEESGDREDYTEETGEDAENTSYETLEESEGIEQGDSGSDGGFGEIDGDNKTSDFRGKDNTAKNRASEKTVSKGKKPADRKKPVKSSNSGTSAEDIISMYM